MNPDPPGNNRTCLFIWKSASEGYWMNHKAISWVGSTGISFIHAGSIMHSSKVVVDSTELYWVMGARACMGHYFVIDLTGLMGEKMFPLGT